MVWEPSQLAQGAALGFRDNGVNAGAAVFCRGSHLLCVTARQTVALVRRETDAQGVAGSVSSPKGAEGSTVIHPQLSFLTQNTNSVCQ